MRGGSRTSCARDPRVDWVNYAGFTDNPSHGLAMKYLGGRASSVFTFGVAGGLVAAKRVYDALGMIKRVVNLGDVRSLACHPASTTHRQMTRGTAIRRGDSTGGHTDQCRHRTC